MISKQVLDYLLSAPEERAVQKIAPLCPFVQFITSILQRHAKEKEFLERDQGGSAMQPSSVAIRNWYKHFAFRRSQAARRINSFV